MKEIVYRAEIENYGLAGAGVIDESGPYQWVRVLSQFNMYVHKNDKSVSPHLANEGYWESWITAWVANNVAKGSTFIDVGANTGYYSFLAAALGATVFAFEPNKDYASMMRSTINRTHSKSVFVFETALSNYYGEAVLNIPTELHGSASLSAIPGYETTKQRVKVEPLDEFVFPVQPDEPVVIKIDAEGEEERILSGARQTIKDFENLTILMEYTPEAYSDYFVADLFNYYDVTHINYAGYESTATPEGLLRQTDWIMLVLRPKNR